MSEIVVTSRADYHGRGPYEIRGIIVGELKLETAAGGVARLDVIGIPTKYDRGDPDNDHPVKSTFFHIKEPIPKDLKPGLTLPCPIIGDNCFHSSVQDDVPGFTWTGPTNMRELGDPDDGPEMTYVERAMAFYKAWEEEYRQRVEEADLGKRGDDQEYPLELYQRSY